MRIVRRGIGIFQAVALIALLGFSTGSHAATDPVKNFGSSLDGFSQTETPFPEKTVLFDTADKGAPLEFGKGQPWRLINFWAAWCAPCIAELPTLKALQERNTDSKDFKILFVNADTPGTAANLQFQMKKLNIPMVASHYTKDFYLWQTFGLEGLPTTILVSPEGVIRYRMLGDAIWNGPTATAFFQAVLPKGSFH